MSGRFGPPGQKSSKNLFRQNKISDNAIEIFWSGWTKINNVCDCCYYASKATRPLPMNRHYASWLHYTVLCFHSTHAYVSLACNAIMQHVQHSAATMDPESLGIVKQESSVYEKFIQKIPSMVTTMKSACYGNHAL